MNSKHALDFQANPYLGDFRAQVVNTQDPEKLLRVQVRVPGLWDAVPDGDLPWAEYLFIDARARGGHFNPAELGDWLWVDFVNGDTRYPRIKGWCHFVPSGQPDTPHEAWQGSDKIVHKLDDTISEPNPQAPDYHGSQVSEKFGLVTEINPDGELMITQRATGTAFRISKSGDITIHSEKVSYHSSKQDHLEHIGGNHKQTIDGHQTVIIDKNCTIDISGSLAITSGGTMDITAGGNMKLTAPKIDLN